MRSIKRTRPRPKGDRWSEMRAAGVGNIPAQFKPRRGNKFADPEDILQGETNELLATWNLFQFRLSAHVLSKAHDSSVGGWPDDPIIIKLVPGMSLIFPLELKKPGETLRPNQIDMQGNIGTVMADTYPVVEAYVRWAVAAAETLRTHLRDHPLPPAPESKA